MQNSLGSAHSSGSAQVPKSEFRHDIQALRALAVVLVLVYHLWPRALSGGYVGVDAFFVISGYLITKHLSNEVKTRGSIRLARFWARRAQRLLPASLLVLSTVTVSVWLWVPLSLRAQFFREVIASSLFFENWQLASDAVDYLAAGNSPSPTQHFWTLSVEEQFYIALPLLVVAAARAGSPARAMTRIQLALGAVIACSFAYSILATSSSPDLAFFSTFTRAWEFGLGAALALRFSTSRGSNPIALTGVTLLLAAALTFDHSTAMPGFAAALPVVGTLLVLHGGSGSVIDTLGRFAPVGLVGRISYSIYLWHWPLIIIGPYLLGRSLGNVDLVAIGLLSVLIAWASTDLIEDPIRFGRPGTPSRSPALVATWSIASVLTVVGATAIVAQRHNDRLEVLAQTASANPAPEASPRLTDTDAGEALSPIEEASEPSLLTNCRGAEAMDPELNCVVDPDEPIVPNPAVAADDDANEGQCWGHGNICTLGETDEPTFRVLAVGDSHNNSLIAVYRAIATNNDWLIDVNGLGGCYLTTSRQEQPSDDHEQSCENWRASTIERAVAGQYDAIIVTRSTGDRIIVAESREERRQLTVDGLVEAWSQLPEVPIIAIRDNPRMANDVISCVELEGREAASACSRPRSEALLFDGSAEAAAELDNAHVIDLSDFFCNPSTCEPVIGNVLVYQDNHHLTETYTLTMIRYYEELIVPLVVGQR